MVFIMRGLFSILSMKLELPHGQRGKEAAHGAAAKALEQMVQVISTELGGSLRKTRKQVISSSTKTPVATKTPLTQKNSAILDTKTPRTGRRKKSVCFGSVRGRSIERLPKPTLKEENTPLRKVRSGNHSSTKKTPQSFQKFPMFEVLIGMLQKLLTLKDLNRSDMRQQTVGVLVRCLPHLPIGEQETFLRFVIRVCHSKLPVHRLAGCELVGHVLSSLWFWKHEGKFNAFPDVSSPSTPSVALVNGNKTPSESPSSSSVPEMEFTTLARALLVCLNGRLLDKSPVVRARAAYSVVQVIDSPLYHEKTNDSGFHATLETLLPQILNRLGDRIRLDEKATVRKAAIVALSKASLYCQHRELGESSMENHIELLGRLCGDASLTSRKAAAQALTDWLLLQHEQSNNLNEGNENKYSFLESTW
eukprot:CAMPEP_0194157710 /NCGR_PEP_ID=MMETSP0152-20130528/73078_1 /TAXON_ID=1049557 /ORGANISM="Thalassiothrix antarctica, Strain L6-D1" /LENGTH=419 /DNA_ID=CAMNT_0038866317 /DNA_START=202 /DNA_END=1458 /DNA_ORIENTATION=-